MDLVKKTSPSDTNMEGNRGMGGQKEETSLEAMRKEGITKAAKITKSRT